MRDTTLNKEAIRENASSLAAALGIDVDKAEELLSASVLVTCSTEDEQSQFIAEQLCELLVRTLRYASADLDPECVDAEVVIGTGSPRSAAPKIWVSADASSAQISYSPTQSKPITTLHPAVSLVVACYAAAATLRLTSGKDLDLPYRDTLNLDLQSLGVTPVLAESEVDMGVTYLAGAGAIGNAFLWALRYFRVSGQLHIVDFDSVKGGNLNRQIWFENSDVLLPKAIRLAEKAQPFFSKLELVPRKSRLQDLPEKKGNPRWLQRLIVAVDSRIGRRSLQSELPGEVYDASTTDIREVVLHFNKQPSDLACMACIYPSDDAETGRERDIAGALGVPIEEVHKGVISPAAAQLILARYPDRDLTLSVLEGEAYDSLFKALCAQAALMTEDGRQVFAPFAFVSVLAGTLLVIETIRRLSGEKSTFNYWKVSPWMPFLQRLQYQVPANKVCSLCGSPIIKKVIGEIWS